MPQIHRALHHLGIELISTGGISKLLRPRNSCPPPSLAGVPEMHQPKLIF